MIQISVGPDVFLSTILQRTFFNLLRHDVSAAHVAIKSDDPETNEHSTIVVSVSSYALPDTLRKSLVLPSETLSLGQTPSTFLRLHPSPDNLLLAPVHQPDEGSPTVILELLPALYGAASPASRPCSTPHPRFPVLVLRRNGPPAPALDTLLPTLALSPISATLDHPCADRSRGYTKAFFPPEQPYLVRIADGITAQVRNHDTGVTIQPPSIYLDGLLLNPTLPTIPAIDGSLWHTRLRLCRPNPFLAAPFYRSLSILLSPNQREQAHGRIEHLARDAVFRAVATGARPAPAHHVYPAATSAGMQPPASQPFLTVWHPDPLRRRHHAPPNPDSLLVSDDLPAPDKTLLHRAFQLRNQDHRLLCPDSHAENQAWYRAIPLIRSVSTVATVDGTDCPAHELAPPGPNPDNAFHPLPPRPVRIVLNLRCSVPGSPDAISVLPVDTDLAFAILCSYSWHPIDETAPLVTFDSKLDAEELARLLDIAFFDSSPDSEEDSPETRRAQFRISALHLAHRILHSDESAATAALCEILPHQAAWAIPPGYTANIFLAPGAAPSVNLSQDE